jgi:threonine/homoserine/homoserine lactone efflux protein
VAGAAYLIYLGITTLRARDPVGADGANSRPRLPWHRAWLQGVVSAALNPKLGVFFLTLLPQFISPGDPPIWRALQLAVVFELIGLVWLLMYSAMLGALGTALGRPGPRRLMRWLTGTILVGLGARVALERT